MLDFFRDYVLGQALNWIVPTVITVVVSWVGVLYTRITGKNIDAANRDALQVTLENGVRAAIQAILNGKLTPAGTVPEDKVPEVLEFARDYTKDGAPDAIRHFKLSERDLNEKLLPHLPMSISRRVAKTK